MHNPSNRRYPDGFIRNRSHQSVTTQRSVTADLAIAARLHERNQLREARRVRQVASFMIEAAGQDSHSSRLKLQHRRQRIIKFFTGVRQNIPRYAAVGLLTVFTATSVLMPLLQADNENRLLQLDASRKQLVGETRDDAAKYLKYDATNKTYTFAAEQRDTSTSYDHTGRTADAYEASLPQKAREGITVTDTDSKIDITLTPQFFTTPAKKTDSNNVVYQSGNRQLVYTLKYNGLKEDIILPSFQGDDLQFGFKLSLPKGVEARLDDDGNIGIYSSDTKLFGDISFGSDADRQKVELARDKGEKNNLVMTIPYPVVKDAHGKAFTDRAKYTLSNKETIKRSLPDKMGGPDQLSEYNSYSLGIQTNDLKPLTYPISIDPTIQVGSASDFAKLNNDTNATVDTTNGLIKRGSLTGGFTNAWTSNTNHLPYAAQKHGAVIYNGYLYIHGGLTAMGNDYRVYSAPIDPTTGSIGTFTAVSAVVGSGRSTHAIFAYNGYFYIIGNGSAGGSGTTLYAKINSDGTIGTFTSSTTMQVGRRFASYTLSNGYIYVAGGCTAFSSAVDTGDCTAFASTTEYAQIKPDGTLSSWQTTAALPAANRMLSSMTNYNGNLYFAGGEDDGDIINNAVVYNTVYMAHQNSDGSLGTWVTLNTMPGSGKNSHESYAYGGYLYEVGGYNTVSYTAPINADGTIGSWMINTALPFSDAVGVMLGSNNYLYIVGGATPNTGDEILVTDLNAAGSTPGWTQDSGTSYSTARRRHGVAAYNGYLYIAGGCGVSSCGSGDALSDVQYAPLNADGSVGTWAATSSLTTQRAGCSIAIYNGVMYVSGGFQNLLQIFTTSVDRAVINANGTLGTFTADSNNFSQGRSQHTSVAYNGFLYIIGGRDTQNSAFTSVERASINASDGSLGTFSPDTPLSTRRAMGKAVVSGGRIYMIGGCTDFTGGSGCTAATNSIEFATIASNGSLTWSGNPSNYTSNISSGVSFALKGFMYVVESGNLKYAPINPNDGTIGSTWTSLPGTVDHGETYSGDMYNDYLYVVGGSIGTRVDYAQIHNGGAGGITSWTTGSTINPRANHNVVALNGYIYVLGGACSGVTGCTSSMSTQVQYGTIDASSGAVTWATASNSISVRKNAGAFAYNGRLYVLGGCTNSACNTYTRTIQYVAPNASTGNITTAWTTNAANVPGDNVGVQFIPYDGYVYRIGGNVSAAGRTATTEYTTIDATTGAIGSSWMASTSLNNTITSNRLSIYNGYIYSVGGSVTGNVETNIVEVSRIQPNHSLGVWSIAASLPTARQGGGLTVLNGYIYAIAGYRSGANRLKDVQYAPILGDGRIGAWQATTSLNVVKTDMEVVVINGRAYAPGGSDNSGNPLSDVEYGTLNVIPREASFSRLYDFDAGVRPTKLITRGTKQTGSVTAATYSTNNAATGSTTLDNTQNISNIGYSGANITIINLGTNRTLSRYLFLQYTIDDSLSAVFPDSGTESTITDFDMYYTSNPGDRLRGGRTFTNGSDRGLEANPQ